MNIEMKPGMICSFESDERGAMEFVVYGSEKDVHLDRRERIKKRVFALVFTDLKACERFFTVNFVCLKQICNKLQNPQNGH